MADDAIVNSTVSSVPKDYTLSGTQQLLLKAVRASYDGSGAGSAWKPALQMVAPNGTVMWTATQTSTIAAGVSANVSWFPGLGGIGGAGVQALIGARIQATSTQSVADSTNTDLVYQQVLFDTGGMANLGSDARILTVQTAGLYLVVCQTVWAPNGAGRRINVAVHNGFYSSGSIPAQDSQSEERPAVWNPVSVSLGRTSNTCTGIYQAASGDFFASGGFQGSGAALNANGFANCFLSALLIGA